MEKQNNSIGKTVLIVLLLIVTIASLVLATYAWAKYTSTTNGTATANVAKWNVSFDENMSTFTGSYTHVTDGTIAPGTNGTFVVEVIPGNTEVCFDYTIKIDSIKFLNTAGDEVTTIRTADAENNVTAVTASELKSHITFTCGSQDLKTTPVITGTYTLSGDNENGTTGSFTPNTTADGASVNATTKAVSRTIAWNWAYQKAEGTDAEKATWDEIDTAAGEYANANGLKLEIKYTVTATQVEPNGTHVN